MDSTDATLDEELAKISIVKSTELTSMARNSSDLVNFQNIINQSGAQADLVKVILENSEPHQITPELANFCDQTLIKADVPLVPPDSDVPKEQAGCESLGFTLMPEKYKELRLAGIESFLGDALNATSSLLKRFSAGMKDQYLLLTESINSLRLRLDNLEKRINDHPTVKYGVSDVVLGYRLYNLFKANDKLNENWSSNFSKVVTTLKALSTGYFKTYSDNLNDTFAFFGGFEGITREEAEFRLYSIPDYVGDIVFKECSIPNREMSTAEVAAKTSIILMGEYFFLNGTRANKRMICTDVQDVAFFIEDITRNNFITFTSRPEVDYGKAPAVKNLGTNEIKNLIKLMNSAIVEITKIHSGFNRLEIGDTEYMSIVKAISRNDWDGFELTVMRNFETLMVNRHNDFANIRSKVTNYLILLINGLIEFCNQSIESVEGLEE